MLFSLFPANDQLVKKYKRGWYLVSGTSSLLANTLPGESRILKENELDHLKKAHAEAEVLMATTRETCAALFLEAYLGNSAASLTNIIGDGPSEF